MSQSEASVRSRISHLWPLPEEQDPGAMYLRGWLSLAAAEYGACDHGLFGGCSRGRGRGYNQYCDYDHHYHQYSTSASTSFNSTIRSKHHRQQCQFCCQSCIAAPNCRSHARPYSRLGVNSLGWWSPSAVTLLGARMHGRGREERPFSRDGAGSAQSCCQPGAVREYRRVTAARCFVGLLS